MSTGLVTLALICRLVVFNSPQSILLIQFSAIRLFRIMLMYGYISCVRIVTSRIVTSRIVTSR